jgi:glycosyltransferase involved in cell wall biosynthesis
MRILIANGNRNIVGGAERYLQALLPCLLARGHELGFMHERPLDRSHEYIGAPELHLATWCVAELGLSTALRALDEWKPDVVYSHGLESAELEAALLRAYPNVLFAHNYYGICGTGTKCHSFPNARPCTRRFGPMCALLHYPRRCGGLNPAASWRVVRRQMHFNSALPRYRAILVASRHMHQEFLRHGVDAARIHLTPLPPPGVNRRATPPAATSPRGRILFLGRFTNLKGVDYLIRAMARAEADAGPLTLTLAGEGLERQRLEDLAHRLHVAARFCGWIPASEKRSLMGQMDLLAVPSVWPEPFGLVGIEAGCMGLPAVGYAVGGIPDWLIPGHSGELAPGDPPTVDGLAEAIVRCLSDPQHYSRLCRGAWEVAGRFTMEAHVSALEPILCAEACSANSVHGMHSSAGLGQT